MPSNSKEHRPDLRLTVDTPEDFQVAEHIANNFKHNPMCSLVEIIEYLDVNPQIRSINSNIKQKIGKPIKIKNIRIN